MSAPPAPLGARPPSRNAAAETDEDNPFEDFDDSGSVHADEGFDYDEPPVEAEGSASSGGSPPARPKKGNNVDAGTQAETSTAEWTSDDMRRALRLLHSVDPGVVERTLRRLHIRLWHAPAARMIELRRMAGAHTAAIKLVKEIVDTCRI